MDCVYYKTKPTYIRFRPLHPRLPNLMTLVWLSHPPRKVDLLPNVDIYTHEHYNNTYVWLDLTKEQSCKDLTYCWT